MAQDYRESDAYRAYVRDVTAAGDLPNDGPIETLSPEMAGMAAAGGAGSGVIRKGAAYLAGKVKGALAERARQKALDKVFKGAGKGIDWGKYRKDLGKYLGRELPDYEKIARDERIGAVHDGLVDALRGAKIEPTKIKDAMGGTKGLRVGLEEFGNYFLRKGAETGVQQLGIEVSQAAKGGSAPDLTGISNFLATDKVPDTIFGIPVVSRKEDYTERDIEFFKEHPEAGGYYDMGDEADESAGAWGGGDTDSRAEYPSERAMTDRYNQAIAAALPFVLEHEGFREKAYRNKGDKWTIGHGLTTIPDKVTGRMRKVVEGDTITEAESKRLASRFLRNAAAYAYKNYEWSKHASPYALAAALDVMYNAGPEIFGEAKSPTMYANMNNIMTSGSFGPGLVDAEIRRQLPTYRTFNGKVLTGLVNRRRDADERFFAAPKRTRQVSANVRVNDVHQVVRMQKGAK